MMSEDLTCFPVKPMPGVEVLSRKKTAHRFETEGRKRILIVDDDPNVRVVISEILASLDYDVVAGRNGMEGLALCEEGVFEFVLTDLNMPTMDGLTLARHIKAEYPFIPVVLMTGDRSVRDTLSNQIQEGIIDDFLFKPFRLADLRRTFLRLSPALDRVREATG